MKSYRDLTEGKSITTLAEGDTFKTPDGANIKILTIVLVDLHKSKPDAIVQYSWQTEYKEGKESKRLADFAKSIVREG
jgi:hypothetical protein